jgi:Tfp pilus assembly ATPase PilU
LVIKTRLLLHSEASCFLVKSLHLSHGIQNGLITQLDAASQFLEHKPMIKVCACAELNGFIQHLQGLARSGQITLSDALQLMNSAQAIQNALGC